MTLPHKFLVDTNVGILANQSVAELEAELVDCALKCVELLTAITKRKYGLVIDDGDEIFDEYRKHLKMSGQPGVGDTFMKWVNDNRYSFPMEDRVTITKEKSSYQEFPLHTGLKNFDNADRKFIAVANAHPASPKPIIFQATDCKWWGWQTALAVKGIRIAFLCEGYVKRKYQQKFANRAQ